MLDPQEIKPKFRDPVLLIDLEDKTSSMEVSPDYARNEYRQQDRRAHRSVSRDKARAAGHGLFPHEHGAASR